MATRDDLFSTVSQVAVSMHQEPTPVLKPRKPKKRIASQAERYRITKLLEEHLTQKNTNGLISYLNEMDDHKIAALVGPHISHDTVRNMRQQIFGNVKKMNVRVHDDEMDVRMAKLEENTTNQHAALSHLINMFNMLAAEIGSDLRIYTD